MYIDKILDAPRLLDTVEGASRARMMLRLKGYMQDKGYVEGIDYKICGGQMLVSGAYVLPGFSCRKGYVPLETVRASLSRLYEIEQLPLEMQVEILGRDGVMQLMSRATGPAI